MIVHAFRDYNSAIFTERRYAKRGIYRRRVYVTLRYCIKMAKRRSRKQPPVLDSSSLVIIIMFVY